ncbi:hypothetical protein CLG96_06620 [Sphingomonas oleivorans]|uniref:Uncharacterized protein n=1 Tax=Sphingomonas oleivorans TaxID=1735121 RepID=A0A2T5FZT4_9SPHN|nr:hypothetical protein [Sphingomonas oleivorans]PTQ12216.1 hypothetical protein CLG96_06620 [Sphingomonas oleivorans]
MIGTYKTADFTFSAHLSFNKDGRLVDVDLRLDPRQCHRLKDAMFAKYGSVESSLEDMEIFEWRDGSARNLVSMVSLDGEPAICAIGYSPLPEDQTEGL